MRIDWKISSKDIHRVKDFYNDYKDNDYVRERIKYNIKRKKPYLSKGKIWYVLVGCLLTTQQRSGPESNVSKFLKTRPFPLSYKTCLSKRNVEEYSYRTLSTFKGIRRTNRIASEIAANLTLLEKSLWTDTLSILKTLQKKTTPDLEREAAIYVDDNFHGFGPKQSRNFLQWLGLSRYEIPIDSRIIKWLNEFGFPIELSSAALGDRKYYQFVSNGIQKLCMACNVYPCVLDAAVFDSFNGNVSSPKK